MSELLPFITTPKMLLALAALIGCATILGLYMRDLLAGASAKRPWRLPAAIALSVLSGLAGRVDWTLGLMQVGFVALLLLWIGVSGGRPIGRERPEPLA